MALSSDLLARALEKLTKLLAEARSAKSRRQFAQASRALGEAWKSVFSLDRRFLQMMQPGEVATMLANPAKVRGLAEVLAEEADLLRLQGDAESAAATAKWAARMVEAAKLPQGDPQVRSLLTRLRTMATLD